MSLFEETSILILLARQDLWGYRCFVLYLSSTLLHNSMQAFDQQVGLPIVALYARLPCPRCWEWSHIHIHDCESALITRCYTMRRLKQKGREGKSSNMIRYRQSRAMRSFLSEWVSLRVHFSHILHHPHKVSYYAADEGRGSVSGSSRVGHSFFCRCILVESL